MKIPETDLVKTIINKVLDRRGIVHSQEELAEEVTKDLKKYDKEYEISPNRARRMALETDINIKVETRRSHKERPKHCPVCGKSLSGLYAKNLFNKRIQVGFKCKCGYRADINAFIPKRYEFRKRYS